MASQDFDLVSGHCAVHLVFVVELTGTGTGTGTGPGTGTGTGRLCCMYYCMILDRHRWIVMLLGVDKSQKNPHADADADADAATLHLGTRPSQDGSWWAAQLRRLHV